MLWLAAGVVCSTTPSLKRLGQYVGWRVALLSTAGQVVLAYSYTGPDLSTLRAEPAQPVRHNGRELDNDDFTGGEFRSLAPRPARLRAPPAGW
ncbi:hypothetical protein Q5H93_23975 [Hymenobacter sp. ASUV-10]|uniref:Uncharacterized protein n=1 Tax=Hymenobacter aranciens TaxID=3063996 RepID=A0ABT9BHV5_9BACT|nr:hypothetical protein [Hymenobacter sp. ASUV-10]MDO7877816.1 hypothetical protein [Hymenobacter sp. ASUV-10]